MSEKVCLQAEGLTTGYGGLRALWDVDLEVREGSALVLLGANGAGKSTLLRCIMGLLPLWSGQVRYFGESMAGWRPDKRMSAAISYTSESGVFAPLSVEENLKIGAYSLPRAEARSALARTWEQFPMLAERRRAPGGSLSGGQRKLLALAKALIAGPRLLVMDEPSAGLSPLLVSEMVTTLSSVRKSREMTLLLAEQNAKFLDIADRVCLLNGGRRGFEGPVAEFRRQTNVAAEFFGLPEAEVSKPPGGNSPTARLPKDH